VNAAPFSTIQEDDWLIGPWRSPQNIARHAAGTIHDDTTAQALGLRGGTVAGSIHMEQCTPLLAQHFGAEWFRYGGLSLYFRHATQDGEPVQARLRSDGERADVEIRNDAEAVVAEGSASLGADPSSVLRQRLAKAQPPRELRILEGVRLGAEAEQRNVVVLRSQLNAYLPTITERQATYNQFGALPYNLAIDLLRAAEPKLARLPPGVVGLYGGIEVQAMEGPLLADQAYTVRARVVGLGDTPQTEVLWHQAEAFEDSGALVCTLLMMSRVMKASSKLWLPA
jgi:hypothetical protein